MNKDDSNTALDTPTRAHVRGIDPDTNITVANSGGEIAVRVSNGEFAALAFLNAQQADELSHLLGRASIRASWPEGAAMLDADDWRGAMQLLLDRMEARR